MISCNLDTENYETGRPSIIKVINFLRDTTETKNLPVEHQTEINKFHRLFKKNIQQLYLNYWEEQKLSSSKLDFYYRYKKVFRFEKYLDNIPKHIRCHTTRLRLSSHCLPVEVLRYRKNKLPREERKCPICNLNKTGDEEHYLLECTNAEILHIRKTFFDHTRAEVSQLQNFSNRNIIDYCLNLCDSNIQMKFSIFVKNILEMYKEESEGTREKPELPTKTKSGREIRKPNKLNL